MFFETKDQLLPNGVFKSSIIPRPIAWISSMDKDGVTNLAPFSYFQAICDKPPMIMFVASPKKDGFDAKDTAKNVESTKEFVINLVPYSLRQIMDQTSNPLEYGESEIEKYNIATRNSKLVKPPSIEDSPINIECEYVRTIPIEKNKMIIGKVLGIQVKDKFIKDNKIDAKELEIIARLGYSKYTKVSEAFSIRD